MSDNQQFCLRWNNHQSTLVQVIDSLLSSGVLVDCTLAAEGQYLHAHKVVLCACSPYLETLLSQHYEKHPIVILKDVKFQELKSMMDYMYKGEVNISQDQLGQFLKAAESLQIKGLTDGGGGENDSRDVGSTSQKRHEPAPVRKTIPHNQSRSPVVLPSHTSGLTIEPTKRTLPTHLSESQPDSPIRSREGSTSPTPRKRRRPRRLSQGEDDGHADNSCDLPMQPQSMSISSVPSSIPPLPSGSSSTITKAPPPDEDSENPESDRLSGLPEGLIKEKIEPQSEMLIEPKTEYMDETNNDDSVEDLTLDDDDDYDGMMEAGAGPSHGGNNPNENYATWQQITGDRQDDAYLNPADTGHRDSQVSENEFGDSSETICNITEGIEEIEEINVLPQFTENDESESVEEVVLQSENVQMEGENPFESAEKSDFNLAICDDSTNMTESIDSFNANLSSNVNCHTEDSTDSRFDNVGVELADSVTKISASNLDVQSSSFEGGHSLDTESQSDSIHGKCVHWNSNHFCSVCKLKELSLKSGEINLQNDSPLVNEIEEVDENKKRYNLKEFSILLSKDLCNEFVENQEKLKFLGYFKMMKRDSLPISKPSGSISVMLKKRTKTKAEKQLMVKKQKRRLSLEPLKGPRLLLVGSTKRKARGSSGRRSLTSTVPAKKVVSQNKFRLSSHPQKQCLYNEIRRKVKKIENVTT